MSNISRARDRAERFRRPHFVYEFWSEHECLYVGMTSSPAARFTSHATKPWWYRVQRIEAVRYPGRDAARAAESARITELQPAYNWQHTENGLGNRSDGVVLRRKADVLGEGA